MNATVEILEYQAVASATQVTETVVVVEESTPEIVEIVSVGPQGIQGPIGPVGPPGPTDASSIVGYPVVLASGQPDDLLSFTGSEWTNKPQAQVTDGGNF